MSNNRLFLARDEDDMRSLSDRGHGTCSASDRWSVLRRGTPSPGGRGSVGQPRSESDPLLSVLLAEVLLPILERLNDSLDDLEQAVQQIMQAPHG